MDQIEQKLGELGLVTEDQIAISGIVNSTYSVEQKTQKLQEFFKNKIKTLKDQQDAADLKAVEDAQKKLEVLQAELDASMVALDKEVPQS